MSESGFRHCLSVLREHDSDRHLAVLWLPANIRPLGAALYAFAAEVARVPSVAKEPAAGEIRLQWWNEILSGSRDHGGHPVAGELLAQIAAHDLPMRPLIDLVEARRGDLYHDAMPGIAELEAYCGHTSSALFQLLALASGARPSATLADACGHAGIAVVVAGLCRSAGRLRALGHCHVPSEFLAPEGLDAAAYVGSEPDARHLGALLRMENFVGANLAKARTALIGLEGAPISIFLPLCLVEPILKLVQGRGLDNFSRESDLSPLIRHWRFLNAAISGRP